MITRSLFATAVQNALKPCNCASAGYAKIHGSDPNEKKDKKGTNCSDLEMMRPRQLLPFFGIAFTLKGCAALFFGFFLASSTLIMKPINADQRPDYYKENLNYKRDFEFGNVDPDLPNMRVAEPELVNAAADNSGSDFDEEIQFHPNDHTGDGRRYNANGQWWGPFSNDIWCSAMFVRVQKILLVENAPTPNPKDGLAADRFCTEQCSIAARAVYPSLDLPEIWTATCYRTLLKCVGVIGKDLGASEKLPRAKLKFKHRVGSAFTKLCTCSAFADTQLMTGEMYIPSSSEPKSSSSSLASAGLSLWRKVCNKVGQNRGKGKGKEPMPAADSPYETVSAEITGIKRNCFCNLGAVYPSVISERQMHLRHGRDQLGILSSSGRRIDFSACMMPILRPASSLPDSWQVFSGRPWPPVGEATTFNCSAPPEPTCPDPEKIATHLKNPRYSWYAM